MEFRRFAVYHLPKGPLGDFGAEWLGWDARSGQSVARPQAFIDLAPDMDGMTAPAKYGFHATLKAPFRLDSNADYDALLLRTQLVCEHLSPFSLNLGLNSDWGFVALRPQTQPPQLIALEAALVTRLDDLRAPLTPEERDRRKPDALPEHARANLDHWGYPYVLEYFNFHLTLSAQLLPNDAQALQHALSAELAPLLAQPVAIDTVTLMGEDLEGRFHAIQDITLQGLAAPEQTD